MIFDEPVIRKKIINPADPVPMFAATPRIENAVVLFSLEANAAIAAFVDGAFSPFPNPLIIAASISNQKSLNRPNPISPPAPINAP